METGTGFSEILVNGSRQATNVFIRLKPVYTHGTLVIGTLGNHIRVRYFAIGAGWCGAGRTGPNAFMAGERDLLLDVHEKLMHGTYPRFISVHKLRAYTRWCVKFWQTMYMYL